ncbi:MAG: hypothetical protein M3O50_10575 [Myxococcota bacterium]|nr:hypothetical protein [Myxococcota bacterium]
MSLLHATLAFGFLATACSNSSSPGRCFESGFRFAIVVVDATTGVRVCDATVKVTDAADSSIGGPAAHYYSLNPTGSLSSDCGYTGLPVPGAFAITVSKSGYADQTVQGTLKPVIRNHCETLLTEAGTSTDSEEFTIALVRSP